LYAGIYGIFYKNVNVAILGSKLGNFKSGNREGGGRIERQRQSVRVTER
jgi:hypothetical protein